MTDRALQAAKLLEQEGVDASVLHVPTLKPLDEAAILRAAKESAVIVTLENHSVIGGLGSAVAETIALAGLSVYLKKIGMPDKFLECGSVPYLTDKYGLSIQRIVEAAKAMLTQRR